MDALLNLELDTGWTVAYLNREDLPFPFETFNQPAGRLSRWTPLTEGAARDAWLTRAFYLEPLDVCAAYRLQLAAAPARTEVWINGRLLAVLESGGPYDLDVTDCVALEDNTIGLLVRSSTAEPAFGGIMLVAVPCE